MASADVETLRQLIPDGQDIVALLGGPDSEPALGAMRRHFHADVEIVTDMGTGINSVSGFEGLVAAWADWLGPWESYWTELEELREIGDGRILVLSRDRGVPRGGGPAVEMTGGGVWTLEDGLVRRVTHYPGRHGLAEREGIEL